MGYLQKIKQLYKALNDSGFQQYRTCGESLDEAKHDATEDILNATNSFNEYYNFLVMQPTRITSLSLRYEGQDYRNAVQKLDSDRKSKHDVAIGKVTQLNRQFENMKLGKFADIDTSDRIAVANFIAEFCAESINRQTTGIDDMVMNYKSTITTNYNELLFS